MKFNHFYFFLRLGSHLHLPMHSAMLVESKRKYNASRIEEKVDYLGVSGSVDGLESSVEEFDVDYFRPHPSSVKTINP